jgi:hypothetical protein
LRHFPPDDEDDNLTVYPYQAKNRYKEKAIKSVDEMPKSAMLLLKKEG